jgi:hypothetical protein
MPSASNRSSAREGVANTFVQLFSPWVWNLDTYESARIKPVVVQVEAHHRRSGFYSAGEVNMEAEPQREQSIQEELENEETAFCPWKALQDGINARTSIRLRPVRFAV